MACPEVETLLAFARGRLSPGERAGIEEHLDGCGDCRRVLAEGAKFLFEAEGAIPAQAVPSSSSSNILTPGTKISRFEIVAELGAGAAGVVYRAHDPQLDRPVALKLIAPMDPASAAAGEGGERLLREARAMARLSHPNVVNVHDASTYQDQVFVVMELVEGRTLAVWLRERARGWREIVDVFVAAGRGLAAAHGAGLVHRDFKPDNVLIGTDERARVTDFGLARAVRSKTGEKGARVIAGTPAFMAPEQFLARDTDARTDQFSFCVALYGALYGQQPFADQPLGGSPILNLASEVVAGRLRPPPPSVPAPPWLFAVLARGLAADPAGRYPSMDELLADVARRRAAAEAPRLSSRVRAAGLAAAALGMGALFVLWRSAATPPAVRCGNGAVEAGEECDDGNRRNDDGCTSSCLSCRTGGASFMWPGNGHCYSKHDEGKSWPEAEEACETIGGTLVTYTAGFESRTVGLALLQGAQVPSWVGLTRATESTVNGPSSTSPFSWVSGEGVAVSIPWAAGEPQAGCVYAIPGAEMHDPAQRSFGNDWGTAPCEQPLPFVCERAGWSPLEQSGHLYRLFSGRQDFDAAEKICAGAGGHLVTITRSEEQAFVGTLADMGFWIGSTDQAQTGTFAWVTGEASAFKAYALGEPDRKAPRSCIAMGVDDLWHDRPCTDPNPFVCEID